MSSLKDNWETPDQLFEIYNQLFHFVLDAAANEVNHKLPRWFGPGGEAEDALTVDWPLEAGNIWCNPPYSRGNQRRFVEKALEQGRRLDQVLLRDMAHVNPYIVMLLPADTSTKLFHELIQPNGDITFLKGRLKFKGAPQAAKFGSMIVLF